MKNLKTTDSILKKNRDKGVLSVCFLVPEVRSGCEQGVIMADHFQILGAIHSLKGLRPQTKNFEISL